MLNIEKIRKMSIEEWRQQVLQDEHLIPTLCFMCTGVCERDCVNSITEWLTKEAKEEEE